MFAQNGQYQPYGSQQSFFNPQQGNYLSSAGNPYTQQYSQNQQPNGGTNNPYGAQTSFAPPAVGQGSTATSSGYSQLPITPGNPNYNGSVQSLGGNYPTNPNYQAFMANSAGANAPSASGLGVLGSMGATSPTQSSPPPASSPAPYSPAPKPQPAKPVSPLAQRLQQMGINPNKVMV